MQMKKETLGRIILIVLIIIFLSCAIIAYSKTGSMDIESRFMAAVGLENGDAPSETDGGLLGFAIEGNFIVYLIIILMLVMICIFAYTRMK